MTGVNVGRVQKSVTAANSGANPSKCSASYVESSRESAGEKHVLVARSFEAVIPLALQQLPDRVGRVLTLEGALVRAFVPDVVGAGVMFGMSVDVAPVWFDLGCSGQ